MQPNPVLVQIGPITVYWYGVLIVSGAMLAAHIGSRLSSRNGHNPEIAWNMLLVLLFTGILGARIYHIISSWEYYRANPSQMFGLQMSGFGIFGAVWGGLIGLYFFARHNKLRFLEWTDYIAPGLILAQAIGRWGNFFNQELYGGPTDLPWGIYIAPEHRLPELMGYERFHPTFFYESSLCFIGFLILFFLARNWKKGRLWGDLLFLYGIIYGVIRFFIEGNFRPDAWLIGEVPAAQYVSLISIVVFGCIMAVRHKLSRPSMIYVASEPWQPPEDAGDDRVEADDDDAQAQGPEPANDTADTKDDEA